MIEDVLKDNTFKLDINSKHITIDTSLISVGRVEFNTNMQTACVTLLLQEDSAASLVALVNAYNQLTNLYTRTGKRGTISVKLGISETVREQIKDDLIPRGDFTALGVELNYLKSNMVYIKSSGIRVPVKTYVKHEGKQYLRKSDVYKALLYVYADIVYQKSVENT